MKSLPVLLIVILTKSVVSVPVPGPPTTVQNYMNAANAYKNSIPGGTSVHLPKPPAGTANMVICPPPLPSVPSTPTTTSTTTPKPTTTTTAAATTSTTTTSKPIETTLAPVTSTTCEPSTTTPILSTTSKLIETTLAPVTSTICEPTTTTSIPSTPITTCKPTTPKPQTTSPENSSTSIIELIKKLTTLLSNHDTTGNMIYEVIIELINQLIKQSTTTIKQSESTDEASTVDKPKLDTQSDKTITREIKEELITLLKKELTNQSNDGKCEAMKKLIDQLQNWLTTFEVSETTTTVTSTDQTTVHDTSDIQNAASSKINSEISELTSLLSQTSKSSEILKQRIQQLSNELRGQPMITGLDTTFAEAIKELISDLTDHLGKQSNDETRELINKLIAQLETQLGFCNSGINKTPTDAQSTFPDTCDKTTTAASGIILEMSELIAILSDTTTSNEILKQRMEELFNDLPRIPNENLGSFDEEIKELIGLLQDQLMKQSNDGEVIKKVIEQLGKQLTLADLTAPPTNDQNTVPDVSDVPIDVTGTIMLKVRQLIASLDVTTASEILHDKIQELTGELRGQPVIIGECNGTTFIESIKQLIDLLTYQLAKTPSDENCELIKRLIEQLESLVKSKLTANVTKDERSTADTTVINIVGTDVDGTFGNLSDGAENSVTKNTRNTVEDASKSSKNNEGRKHTITTRGEGTNASTETIETCGNDRDEDGNTISTVGDESRITKVGDKSSMGDTASIGKTASSATTASSEATASNGNTAFNGVNSLSDRNTSITTDDINTREDSTTSTGTTNPNIATKSSLIESNSQIEKSEPSQFNQYADALKSLSSKNRVKPNKNTVKPFTRQRRTKFNRSV